MKKTENNLGVGEKKLTYREKLQDIRWQKMKSYIQNRDNWTCRECGATDKPVHVHHDKYYKEPWTAPEEALRLLCCDCHYKEHFTAPDPNANLTPIEIAERLIEDLARKIDSGKHGDKAVRTWEQAIVVAQNEIQRIIDTTQNTTQLQCQTESYATGQIVTE